MHVPSSALRTIKSQLWCVAIVVVVAAVADVASLNGPNVCMVKQKYNITKRVKYRAPMSVRTYEWCFSMPPRCSRWKTEMRDLSRLETEERTAEVAVCCPGYKMKDVSCVPICPSGKTGSGCADDCPENKWGPNCANDCPICSEHGECSPLTGECECKDGWQGESCEIRMSTTPSSTTLMEELLTTTKSTSYTNPTTTTPVSSTAVTNASTVSSTTVEITTVPTPLTSRGSSNSISTTITSPVTTTSTTETPTTKEQSPTTDVILITTVSIRDTDNSTDREEQSENMMSVTTVTASTRTDAYENVTNITTTTSPTTETTIQETTTTRTRTKSIYNRTEISVENATTTPSTTTTIKIQRSSPEVILYTTEMIEDKSILQNASTLNPKVTKFASNTYSTIPTSTGKEVTDKTESTRKPETSVKAPITQKSKPKEIWIKPTQKAPSQTNSPTTLTDKSSNGTFTKKPTAKPFKRNSVEVTTKAMLSSHKRNVSDTVTIKPIPNSKATGPPKRLTTAKIQGNSNDQKNITKSPRADFTTTEGPTEDETFHILTEPEHITAVMSDRGRDRSSMDLVSVVSIAGGVMMAVITVAVLIVMVERCRRPRFEEVRKNIRMQVMIDNNEAPPPYMRSIFHTPLPEPPPTEKCHYQPISTLDRNLKQFMRPVVVQNISPIMLENFRGILECHYDHLPRRNHDFGTMPTRFAAAPSMSYSQELRCQKSRSVNESAIDALKCEAKMDVLDSSTSEPLYAEIPCWRPPSEHAIEVVNLNALKLGGLGGQTVQCCSECQTEQKSINTDKQIRMLNWAIFALVLAGIGANNPDTQYVKSVKGGFGGRGYQYQAGDNLAKYYGNRSQQGYDNRQNEIAPASLDVGVCYIEVPTASLARDPAHVPTGNGSRPDLSRITACCRGYIRNIHNHRICDPVCSQECVNALCTAPETCTCFPDHVKNYAGFCVPTCPIGCQNGRCSGGECLCNNGYKLDSDSKYCLPSCRENCGGIGNCTAPNTCDCKNGYQSTPGGSCRAVCDSCVNGDCVAPNDCRCHEGYTKEGVKCVPLCKQGCSPNGRCVAPNICEFPSTTTSRPTYVPGQPSYNPGVNSNQPGQYTNQPGQYPNQPGQYPNKPSQYPSQTGSYPNNPNQPDQHSNKTGQYPSQPGQYPGQPGQYPGQPGQYPGQPGQYPGQPSQYPEQSGQYPGQPGQYPGQPNQYPGQPGQHPGQHGQYPGQPGQYPGHTGQYPGQNGPYPDQRGQNPDQPNPTEQPQYRPGHNPQYPGPPPSRPGQPAYESMYQPAEGHRPGYALYPESQHVSPDSDVQVQCTLTCINGYCVEGNRCVCNRGYVLDREDPSGTRCIPSCPGGCLNGVCSAPNFCICNIGYYKDHSVKGRSVCIKRIRRSIDIDRTPLDVAKLLTFELPQY
ncbi:unnamed protein product, partial [Iphiclides podalirius]